jgi:hypothetical protein
MRSIPGTVLQFGLDHFHEYLPVFSQNLAASYFGQQRFRNRYPDHFHKILEHWKTTIDGPENALHEIQRSRLIRLVERAR